MVVVIRHLGTGAISCFCTMAMVNLCIFKYEKIDSTSSDLILTSGLNGLN